VIDENRTMQGSLRACRIPVRNGQAIELLTRRVASNLFELWVVAHTAGSGAVVDHYFTTDNLEDHLAYAAPGDLAWATAPLSAIPSGRLKGGFIAGENIRDRPISHERLQYHLSNALVLLPIDRRPAAVARKALLGMWTDGSITLSLASPDLATVRGERPAGHPLATPGRVEELDWWKFRGWQLHLMSRSANHGLRIGVLRADEKELHLANASLQDRGRLAYTFSRSGRL
jgi:hypothetical protein